MGIQQRRRNRPKIRPPRKALYQNIKQPNPKEIQEVWDPKKNWKQNFKTLGLSANINKFEAFPLKRQDKGTYLQFLLFTYEEEDTAEGSTMKEENKYHKCTYIYHIILTWQYYLLNLTI